MLARCYAGTLACWYQDTLSGTMVRSLDGTMVRSLDGTMERSLDDIWYAHWIEHWYRCLGGSLITRRPCEPVHEAPLGQRRGPGSGSASSGLVGEVEGA